MSLRFLSIKSQILELEKKRERLLKQKRKVVGEPMVGDIISKFIHEFSDDLPEDWKDRFDDNEKTLIEDIVSGKFRCEERVGRSSTNSVLL